MEPFIAPAHYSFLGIPLVLLSIAIPVVGIALWVFIMAKRVAPLVRARSDERFDNIPQRIVAVIKIWLLQWRQPRYMVAGVLHIVIFFGFLSLALRSSLLVLIGIVPDFALPGLASDQIGGIIYNTIKDYAATFVFLACIAAAVRRGILQPERYKVPERFGKDHTAEAVFVLMIISTLMISESMFDSSHVVALSKIHGESHFIAPGTLAWVFKFIFESTSMANLQTLHIVSYYIHDFTFFFFLCFLPLGKHFHVITSLFNVFFMRIEKGNIKPPVYGLSDEEIENLDTIGVKELDDFTWKHILDFYTCADCGRCSDNCPAATVGRPLSPRFITIRGRDAIFKHYPLSGDMTRCENVIGDVFEADEIWSCTTCGACEEECPLGIEYIDKMVDMRRGMVDNGDVPQTLQKPLQQLSKKGNAWGKAPKKRGAWTKGLEGEEEIKVLDGETTADTLFFIDSISSYDDRMLEITKAAVRILKKAGIDFGILGANEKDSGNEVLRFGEELLFRDLRNHNMEMIKESGVKRIVTADPHAYNALKKDYPDMGVEIEHISEVIARCLKSGALTLTGVDDESKIFTYHDPCYLGRHNGIYDDPRDVIGAIPNIRTSEMLRSRDRSFCCSGGGLMLFYEPEEEERMGVLRVKMAAKAGANVIVTACPFCMVNMEDAIKVANMEDQMEAIDLVELIDKHLA